MGVAGKININVGVLGHVDSGKTSLCKALSTTGSTAAFDSNPQSKERGITLDLGFSSLSLEADAGPNYNITLVDCPGHSSLIRTVIGGAQIMDIMLLIIDINKGMQPQAAECLILAHITSSHLIVVLNKVDLVAPEARAMKIAKVTKLMRGALSKTKFVNEPIVSASAADITVGTEELKKALAIKIEAVKFEREVSKPFLMAVDHCFSIKGQGTIVTGTVLQGNVKVNDMVEFPTLLESKKVKSIQSFRVSVNEAGAGDRIGICFPGLDSSNIERTVIAASGVVNPAVRAGVLKLQKIPFFKKPIESKKRYHISIGYETVTARVTLFSSVSNVEEFDSNQAYEYVESIGIEGKVSASGEPSDSLKKENANVFALLEFDKPVMTTPYSLVIGSDLQSEDENTCRLAFSGKLVDFTQDKQYVTTYLPKLKIFKEKSKVGQIDRIVSENQLIAKGFCKKESNIDHLIGRKVQVVFPGPASKEQVQINARLESRFGQTDKVRLGVVDCVREEDFRALKENSKHAQVLLVFKKYLFAVNKTKIDQ